MEFKGTKGKWGIFFIDDSSISLRIGNTFPKLSRLDIDDFEVITKEENKANALLISKSPTLFEEHVKEIEFLKRVKKQLDDLGGSMEFEVEERIIYLEKLCTESVTL